MPTIHRVPAGTMPAMVGLPSAVDLAAVQRARIPQTRKPRLLGARAGSVKTPAIYAAASCGGFRYPNKFKEPGPGRMWNKKHDTVRP